MLTHIYYHTTITVAYTVEVPDGMEQVNMAHALLNSEKFYEEHIVPDLSDADWNDVDFDEDDWTDAVDFTADQVRGFLAKDE